MKATSIILVPTDFSEVTRCAAFHAATLARMSGETICLFHVIDKDTKNELKKQKEDISYIENKLKQLCREYEALLQVSCSYKLKEGNIFTTISETATEENASLIVLGTHGVQGIQKLVGAYALKVIASSKVPVIVVQKTLPPAHGIQKIISPIDSNAETKQKTMQTLHLAKMMQAKVYLYKQKGVDEHVEDHIRININFVKKHLTEHHIPFEVVEQEKHSKQFSREFIAYAKSINADLIIILNTNEKGLMEIIIGPDEQYVINNEAQIPVMCINTLQRIYQNEKSFYLNPSNG